MIEEDLTVFLADFGVSITAGAVSGLCLLDMPGEVVFDGVRETYTGALSTMYSITCRTDEFGQLGYGDSVTVDGEVYTVQEAPLLITDGVFCRINLERSAVVQSSLPAVSVAVSPSSTAEDGTTNLVFTFTRTLTAGTLSVNYSIGGTATNGTDYATIGTSVTIPSGQSSGTVTIDPTTDATLEGNETVILTLAPDASYTIGSPNSATGRIMNDEAGTNVFAFASGDTVIVSEAAGVAEVAVIRSGSTAAAATLEYTVTAIPAGATAGADYTVPTELGANLGQVVFGVSQASQVIQVPVVNDGSTEGNELFAVAIQNPSSGSLGAPRTARVLVVDNDGAARVSYLSADLEVAHDAGDLTVTLIRAGSSAFSASVLLTAVAGTAEAGVHFTATSETVTFPIGNVVQTVNVPILATAAPFNFADFTLTIDSPTGASIEGSATAAVRILGPGVDLGSLSRSVFVDGLTEPTTFDWIPGDPDTMLVAQKRGQVRVVEAGVLRTEPLVDRASIVNIANDRGLIGMAIHPDFPASPYVYIGYNYDPPETIGASGNSAPDGNGNRPVRVERLTVNPATLLATDSVVLVGTNSTWAFTSRPDLNSTGDLGILPSGIVNGTTITASPEDISTGYQDNSPGQSGTQNENIRDYIACDSLSHGVGNLEFGPDGYLYLAVGDGTSYNFIDDRAVRVQDIANLSGKLLRFDPLTGAGVPSNPYYDEDSGTPAGTSNQSKVFYYGLRNPYRFTFDPVTELPVLGDVGYTQRESIYTGPPGSNFGWPYVEGDITTPGYGELPQAVAFFANGNINAGSPNPLPNVPPLRALTHGSPDSFESLTMGQFFTNNSFTYADLIDGRVFAATLDENREIVSTTQFDSGVNYLTDIRTGPDGNIYACQIYGPGFGPGRIVRWVPEDTGPPPAVSATLYLPFASDLLDASGNNFTNLHTANPPTFDPLAETPIGFGAAVFNGTSQHLDFGEYPEFFNPGTGDFCIAFWALMDPIDNPNSYPAVISKGSYQSSAGAWVVFFDRPNSTAINFSYGNPWVEQLKSNTTAHPSGVFRHNYIQRSGNTMTLRVNNVLVDTHDVTGVDFTSSHILLVGRSLVSDNWKGAIRDLVYIVGGILTPEQVTALQTAPFSELP